MPIVNPDWVPPIETTFDEGKPIRSEQGLMLAGNPIAMAQGKPGAPKIQLAFTLDDLVAGDTVRWREDVTKTGATDEAVTAFGIGFMQEGTVRFTFEHRVIGAGVGTTTELRRWRNGVVTAVGTYNNTTSFQSQSEDITIVRGDYYELVNTPDSGNLSSLRNCRISTTGMRIWPFPRFAWEP